MELVQFHSFERQSVDGLTAALAPLLGPGRLHPRASLGIAAHGPWRPADRWPGALERLVWTVDFQSEGGALLSARGEAELARGSLERRQAPVHPAELLAARFGDGLVLVHSDAAGLAYAAVYRQRRLSWSLLLDAARLIRCDGEVVRVGTPATWFPEGDRTGVLLAGLEHWLREPIALDEGERFVLPDTLAALTLDAEPTWLVRHGSWLGTPASAGRAQASG